VIGNSEHVVAILTGNVLKDPDYIYRYHTGQLENGRGERLTSTFGNHPRVVENSTDAVVRLLREF
jgi:threonine synthase